MPREQINQPLLLDRSDPARLPYNNNAMGGPWNEPAVHVQWDRGFDGAPGVVRLILEADRGQLENTMQGPVFHAAEDSKNSRHRLMTDTFSRAEVNHLIRTLRRARDVAYGKDE